ncbi:MAG: hypothetical protein V4751_12770 [Pseudomonadota bacterium]
MKFSRKLLFATTATGLSLLAAFFVWELNRRYSLEEQAGALMTDTLLQILSSGDSTLLSEHTDPLVLVQTPDLSNLTRYGRLVSIDPPQGEAQIPTSLSSTAPAAQFATTAHYSLGRVNSEAIMTYRDGLWLFTHFTVVPGPLAE